ncbi:hypothetical protein MKX01_000247 [Papaver californicum]|nr:hypothetical protein MKX01_000247 [Papaver californicum]
MLKVWKWYQTCLSVHPVKTQIISSGILWGLGDTAAQTITLFRSINQIKHKRASITSGFGFGFVGPSGYFWYEGLDRLIRSRLRFRPTSIRFVASKVALDGLIFGPFYGVTFFTYIGYSIGKSVAQVQEDVKRDLIPALAAGLAFGPILQFVNFRFVPVIYQLLYVNMFCLLDSAFMSWIEQQQNAPWKKWFSSLLTFEDQQEKKETKEC